MKYKGYGKIEFVDKRKLKDDGWDDQIEPEFRKPTPVEREEIILNYIRTHNGKPLNMQKLSDLLKVSVRTIQKHLRNLESKDLVIRTPVFTEGGKQKFNKYNFNGKNTPLEETALTIDKLYDPDNPCGFRDWEEFKFIPGYYDENFSKYDSELQGSYLKSIKAKQQAKKDRFLGKK